jgi:hypothetical protein
MLAPARRTGDTEGRRGVAGVVMTQGRRCGEARPRAAAVGGSDYQSVPRMSPLDGVIAAHQVLPLTLLLT